MNKKDIWRCKYHLTPPIGWMNDPNGICQYQGVYHVFFQYAPEYPAKDNKSWGHYISTDLVRWDFQGTSIYPDTVYDKNGAYSGNSFIENNTLVIYYTGNVEQEGDHDYTHSGRESNTIRITSTDGLHFSKKNCILTNADYPENYTCHIRDPKVWQEGNQYKMVLGGRKDDDTGAILLFDSMDGIYWTYSHDVTSNHPFGFMWECPDIFEIENQQFLSCCPQGIPTEEYRHQNYHLSGYFPYSESGIDETKFREWDYGFDFYAPQTFVDDIGRRILIGWVGGPDMTYDEPSLKKHNWIHKLTLPRVISYQNGILYQYPVPELDQLHEQLYSLSNDKWITTKSNCFDWQLELDKSQNPEFTIHITKDIEFSYKETILSLIFYGNIGGGRTIRRARCRQIEQIRILADCSILEIYVNHGEVVQTTHFFPEQETLELCAAGAFIKNHLWEITKDVIHIR